MPIEAVPISFEGSAPVKSAAEAINEELKKGTYIGHIAVTAQPSQYSGPAHVEGIVLLVDVDEQRL